MTKRIEFTLPGPYFAAGHYSSLIREQVKVWAKNHNILESEYTVCASKDRKYKLQLEFANDKHYTLWVLSWDNSNLPNWLVIK